MSPNTNATPAPDAGFPRVSGDEPTERKTEMFTITFSPRERG